MKLVKVAISILFFVFLCGYVYADIYYVQQGVGEDTNPGDDWGEGRALASIQSAIDLASDTPGSDAIHVAAGIYSQHLTLVSDVILNGGYPASGGDTRDPAANPTIIDGGNTGRPVTIAEISNVTIDGFVIQNGATQERGGGIYIQASSSITVNDNAIIDNVSTDDWGGGIAVAESSTDVMITNNNIEGNSSVGSNGAGGGISFWNLCTGEVSGNTILGNTAEEQAGGIIIDECGRIAVLSNTVSDNTARDTAGGIMVAYNVSDCLIDGNIIENNAVINAGGGGICVLETTATITHNTIRYNTSDNDWGGGIRLYSAEEVSITENMIIGNSAMGDNGVGGGISFFETSGGSVINNTIIDNISTYGGKGIHIDTPFSLPIIGGKLGDCNRIYNNGDLDLCNEDDGAVTATYNYWGVMDEASIAARVCGSVLFDPWTDDSCRGGDTPPTAVKPVKKQFVPWGKIK